MEYGVELLWQPSAEIVAHTLGFGTIEHPDRPREPGVAQVPRRHLFEKHRAVVLFGVLDQSRILLGIEELILGDATVAPRIFCGPASQLDELADDFVPARFAAVSRCNEAVDLRVRAEM